jgi:hypothetical protein
MPPLARIVLLGATHMVALALGLGVAWALSPHVVRDTAAVCECAPTDLGPVQRQIEALALDVANLRDEAPIAERPVAAAPAPPARPLPRGRPVVTEEQAAAAEPVFGDSVDLPVGGLQTIAIPESTWSIDYGDDGVIRVLPGSAPHTLVVSGVTAGHRDLLISTADGPMIIPVEVYAE